MQEHARAAIAHDRLDLLAPRRRVAVYRADAAEALDLHARAGGDARLCVVGELLTLRTEPAALAVMVMAVDLDDLGHRLLLPLPLLLDIHDIASFLYSKSMYLLSYLLS